MTIHQTRTSVGPATFRARQTLSAVPDMLPSDPDERMELMKRKLRTGDPVRLAEVVRDLAWRQRRGRASRKDLRLLWRADRQLARWFAAQTGKDRGLARRRMWGAVEQTIALYT
jgi:RNA polymerase-interacting CarD/CdnL/TRCF family regulator